MLGLENIDFGFDVKMEKVSLSILHNPGLRFNKMVVFAVIPHIYFRFMRLLASHKTKVYVCEVIDRQINIKKQL